VIAMPRSTPKQEPGPKTPASRRAAYHHGNLRETLIAATLCLIEESGPERVTVREVAKRAGVSSGAPFRHFPNRTALMTAVAEEAMRRFRAEIAGALDAVTTDDPLARFSAIGAAFLRWAIRNPAHFQVISTRSLIDFDGSASLVRDNDEIRTITEEAVAEARNRGLLRSDDVTHIHLAGRALVYGLARMYIDGHFAQWSVEGETAERAMRAVLDLFVGAIAKDIGDTGDDMI
jgi:AcrR family transcriptional regulator